MSGLEVTVANSPKIWDELVERADYSTVFHRWGWLKTTEQNTKSELYPLVIYKNSTPIAVYPIFIEKKFGLKLALSPPPRCLQLYLGPSIVSYSGMKQSKKESSLIEVQSAADKFLDNLGVGYTRIRTSPFLLDSRPFSWAGYAVSPQYTYVLNLKRSLNQLWESLDRSLRRSIEKAKSSGVEVRDGGLDDLEFIRLSMRDRFQSMGIRVPEDYYRIYLERLYDLFHPENLRIFVVEFKGERVGGLILLCYKDRASYWFGMGKTSTKGIYPNDLLQWEAIRWAWENGFKYYEEMDAGDDPRLRHFKAKFNPDLVPWYSAVKYSSFAVRIIERVFSRARS